MCDSANATTTNHYTNTNQHPNQNTSANAYTHAYKHSDTYSSFILQNRRLYSRHYSKSWIWSLHCFMFMYKFELLGIK